MRMLHATPGRTFYRKLDLDSTIVYLRIANKFNIIDQHLYAGYNMYVSNWHERSARMQEIWRGLVTASPRGHAVTDE